MAAAGQAARVILCIEQGRRQVLGPATGTGYMPDVCIMPRVHTERQINEEGSF